MSLDRLFGVVWGPRLPENFVVVDCESSGLDTGRASVLSLGAVKVSGEEFYAECRPIGDYCEEAALVVNGMDWESAQARAVSFMDLMAEFRSWLGVGRFIFAGKNPQYDWDLISSNLERCELRRGALEVGWSEEAAKSRALAALFSRRKIDLHQWAYAWALMRGVNVAVSDFSTGAVYRYLGFDEEPKPHNALTGAALEMRIFKKLLDA